MMAEASRQIEPLRYSLWYLLAYRTNQLLDLLRERFQPYGLQGVVIDHHDRHRLKLLFRGAGRVSFLLLGRLNEPSEEKIARMFRLRNGPDNPRQRRVDEAVMGMKRAKGGRFGECTEIDGMISWPMDPFTITDTQHRYLVVGYRRPNPPMFCVAGIVATSETGVVMEAIREILTVVRNA